MRRRGQSEAEVIKAYGAGWRRWDPDLKLDSPGPVENPDNLSMAALRRHRLLMDMLLQCGDLETARKITAAYPQVRAEYAVEIRKRAEEIRKQSW